MIQKYLEEKNVHIQHFSLVGWANKRLKLGVNNKEDYIALVKTDKWLTSLKNIHMLKLLNRNLFRIVSV